MRLATLSEMWGLPIGEVLARTTRQELELWPHIFEARERKRREGGKR